MTFLSVGRNLEANAPQIQSQCPLRISMHLAKQAATAYPGDLPPAIAHACRLCCSPSIEVSIPTGEVVCACEFALVISFASVDDSSAAAALHHGPEHAEAPREVLPLQATHCSRGWSAPDGKGGSSWGTVKASSAMVLSSARWLAEPSAVVPN